MASYLTSATLIESAKRRAAIPTAESTFQTSDYLAFANEEIAMAMLPAIMSFHEEYLVYSQDVALVSGQSFYTLPKRAVGGKLRSLFYKDTQGSLHEMSRIDPSELPYYQNRMAYSQAYQYYVQNDRIYLVASTQGLVGSLTMYYYMRPNQLVDESEIATITAINTITGEVTLASIPDSFDTTSLYDFVQTEGAHKTLGMDLTPTSINTLTSTITFSPASLPSDLVVGDMLCFAEQSAIPQIPDDLHSLLAQRIAARCLESLGDQNGLQAANAKIAEMEVKMGVLIDNRVESDPQRVINLRSPLRQTRMRNRRRY